MIEDATGLEGMKSGCKVDGGVLCDNVLGHGSETVIILVSVGCCGLLLNGTFVSEEITGCAAFMEYVVFGYDVRVKTKDREVSTEYDTSGVSVDNASGLDDAIIRGWLDKLMEPCCMPEVGNGI